MRKLTPRLTIFLIAANFLVTSNQPAIATVVAANTIVQKNLNSEPGCTACEQSLYKKASGYNQLDMQPETKAYIGIDTNLISEMINANYNYPEKNGKNAYPKNPFLYTIYFGYHFDEHFGMELGCETQIKKKREVHLIASDTAPGSERTLFQQTGDPNYWENWETYVKTDDVHFLLIYNFDKFFNLSNTKWSVQAGGTYFRMRAGQKKFDDSDGLLPGEQELSMRTFKQAKLIPMVRIGINYYWNQNWGLRLTGGWRQLSLIKPKSQEYPNTNTQIKFKDGFNFGIGVYYNLF